MAMDPVIAWSFLGVGLFGQGVAAMLARRPIRLLRAGGKADGTVTASDEQMISGGRGSARKYYFPQIAFTTAKGERISFKSVMGRGKAIPPGTVVPLIYDPAQPHEATIRSFGTLWMFPLLTSLLSLPFLLVGLSGVFSLSLSSTAQFLHAQEFLGCDAYMASALQWRCVGHAAHKRNFYRERYGPRQHTQ